MRWLALVQTALALLQQVKSLNSGHEKTKDIALSCSPLALSLALLYDQELRACEIGRVAVEASVHPVFFAGQIYSSKGQAGYSDTGYMHKVVIGRPSQKK